MKKGNLAIVCMLVLVILLTACSSDDNLTPTNNTDNSADFSQTTTIVSIGHFSASFIYLHVSHGFFLS